MLDFSKIKECQDEAESKVRNALDMAYIKHQCMLEYMYTSEDVSPDFACILEAATTPVPASKELNVFSFDNTNILEAIHCFNNAYRELNFEGSEYEEFSKNLESGRLWDNAEVDIEKVFPAKMVSMIEKTLQNPSGEFIKGFNKLGQQFQCRFDVNMSLFDGTGTWFKSNIKYGNVSISRTKGFQLGNMRINLSLNIIEIMCIAPPEKKLFGQFFTGVILHEIYHNIVRAINVRTSSLHAEIKRTFDSLKNVQAADAIKTKVKEFINKFKSIFGVKDRDFNDRRAANRLYVLNKIRGNGGAMAKFESDVKNDIDRTTDEEELDAYIEELLLLKNTLIVVKGIKLFSLVVLILMAGLGAAAGAVEVATFGAVGLVVIALSMLSRAAVSLRFRGPVKEEYFCDLFAAMYKLPIRLRSYKRLIELNRRYGDKVSKAVNIENDIGRLSKDEHPTDFTRAIASYRAAKALLDSGEPLDPEIKDYLEYIVKLHDGITDINVLEDKYQNKLSAPEAPKDLNKVLHDFVKKSGVSVTESYDLTHEMIDEIFPITEEGE